MPENEGKSVTKINKIIYILLALFLGMLGIHRFVAGHWFAGICYLAAFCIGSLLTFFFGLGLIILGIEGLVCIYDVIKGCLATADANGDIVI